MKIRPTWREYFLGIAQLAAARSTCLAFPVGAVVTRDNQILATGYNGSPPGSLHCTDLGYCSDGVNDCAHSSLPSRAIHAEANAIAQCAKNGVATNQAQIYVTVEPCISCLKIIIASGIKTIYYTKDFNFGDNMKVRNILLKESFIELIKLDDSILISVI